mgnify:CR=1 FL=1
MSTRNILHFGLNRSGTNYLKELMDQHFDLEFMNTEDERSHPLHKHFRLYDDKSLIGRPNFRNDLKFPSFREYEAYALVYPQYHSPPGGTDAGQKGRAGRGSVEIANTSEETKNVVYVIISKDPYSWHLSYTRWGIKNKWSPSPHPYILEYNEFYRKWIEFSAETDRIAFVRYIDLLKAPDEIMKQLQNNFNLNRTREINPNVRIRKVPMSRRFSKKRLNYYLEETYLEEFSNEALIELNNHLDHEVAKQLGYTIHT